MSIETQEEAVAQTFKILLLGDTGVGKSSLLCYQMDGKPRYNILSTVGVDYSDVMVSVRGVRVKLRVWDTAGQERFRTFTKQFLRGAQGVFLVYDITLYRTFNLLSTWFNILSEASLEGIDVVLVGNKVDLESQRTVPLDLAKRFASDRSCRHVETSCVTGQNIKKTFSIMAESLIHSHNIFIPGLEAASMYERHDSSASGGIRDSIVLSHQENQALQDTKKKCCNKN